MTVPLLLTVSSWLAASAEWVSSLRHVVVVVVVGGCCYSPVDSPVDSPVGVVVVVAAVAAILVAGSGPFAAVAVSDVGDVVFSLLVTSGSYSTPTVPFSCLLPEP